MCWVMPPASPAVTSALRMASSSEVLPWSTWPMTVTTGGRLTSLDSSTAISRDVLLHLEALLLHRVAEVGGQQRRRVGVDELVDGGHGAARHQLADQVGGLDAHGLGERRHRDRLLDADDLLVLGTLGHLCLGSLLGGLLLLAADRHVGAVLHGRVEQLLAGQPLGGLLGGAPRGPLVLGVLVAADVDELALASQRARHHLELADLAERARPGRGREAAPGAGGHTT